VLLVAVAQFALISFDSLASWRPRLLIHLPSGDVNLLAHGFFIQYEASEETAPGYAIAPDVLSKVEQARVAQGRDRINLGLLVNSYQLHEKHFLYQIYTTYPRVTLRELARNWNGQPAYNQLFEMDFVLLNDTHTFRTSEPSQAVVERILTQPHDLFNLAFRPVHQWTLPNGEKSTLYARRFAPTEPGLAPGDYQALLQQFGADWGAGDALVLTKPIGIYLYRVFEGSRQPLAKFFGPAERFILRICGVRGFIRSLSRGRRRWSPKAGVEAAGAEVAGAACSMGRRAGTSSTPPARAGSGQA